MRNDHHVEARAVDAVDGERRAVERDRAFFRDEARQLRRRLEDEARHVALIVALDDFRHAIDVSADQMSAELVAELQRPLEIDPRALASMRRASFARSVSGEASTSKKLRFPAMPRSTTVRHGPPQAIDAPIAISSGS